MPSEPRPTPPDPLIDVRAALLPARERFRSIVAATVEQLREQVQAGSNSNGNPAADAAELVGDLGARLIDVDRFAALTPGRAGNPVADLPTKTALAALRELLGEGDAAFEIDVGPDQSLTGAVSGALARLGRAFGAARAIKLAQRNEHDDERHAALLSGVEFSRWTRAERGVAPPLAVRVPGGKLRTGGLAEFMEGMLQIVLVAEGQEAPAAPLAALITPRRLVLQTSEPSALKAVAAWQGPAVAALLPVAAAQFLHDPSGGETYAERLQIGQLPAIGSIRSVGEVSADSQADDLAHLAALAEPGPRVSGEEELEPDETEARLAAWLLKQARM